MLSHPAPFPERRGPRLTIENLRRWKLLAALAAEQGNLPTRGVVERARKLVGVFMAQGPSSRTHTRNLFRNPVYDAMLERLRG